MQVKKQQLELDMEQETGSKLGKEYIKAVHCHPAYLTYMQSTLLGACMRTSTCGKGHEEGGSTYAKAGLSLRSPPGNP